VDASGSKGVFLMHLFWEEGPRGMLIHIKLPVEIGVAHERAVARRAGVNAV
jgi:hypothetical protein